MLPYLQLNQPKIPRQTDNYLPHFLHGHLLRLLWHLLNSQIRYFTFYSVIFFVFYHIRPTTIYHTFYSHNLFRLLSHPLNSRIFDTSDRQSFIIYLIIFRSPKIPGTIFSIISLLGTYSWHIVFICIIINFERSTLAVAFLFSIFSLHKYKRPRQCGSKDSVEIACSLNICFIRK